MPVTFILSWLFIFLFCSGGRAWGRVWLKGSWWQARASWDDQGQRGLPFPRRVKSIGRCLGPCFWSQANQHLNFGAPYGVNLYKLLILSKPQFPYQQCGGNNSTVYLLQIYCLPWCAITLLKSVFNISTHIQMRTQMHTHRCIYTQMHTRKYTHTHTHECTHTLSI